MIEIGGMPILWHIMKMYEYHGITDFIICAGYKQNSIKEFFSNYAIDNCDVTFDYRNGTTTIHNNFTEPWNVTVSDTGLNTMTGGRIKRIDKYLGDDESFCLTYGDGVSDVPLDKVIKFHTSGKKLATITAVHPEGRFGIMEMSGNDVTSFREKKTEDTGWINGGFMVLDRGIMDHIDGDHITFEREPLEKLAKMGQLNAYKHIGFWQCMDTLRDKEKLQKMWDEGTAPWKKW